MSASQFSERMDSCDQQFKYLQALWLVAAAGSHRLPDIVTWLILCQTSDATVSWYQSPSPICVVFSESFARNGYYLCCECWQEEQLWNKSAHRITLPSPIPTLEKGSWDSVRPEWEGMLICHSAVPTLWLHRAQELPRLLSPVLCPSTELRHRMMMFLPWCCRRNESLWCVLQRDCQILQGAGKSVLLRIGSCWDCTIAFQQ